MTPAGSTGSSWSFRSSSPLSAWRSPLAPTAAAACTDLRAIATARPRSTGAGRRPLCGLCGLVCYRLHGRGARSPPRRGTQCRLKCPVLPCSRASRADRLAGAALAPYVAWTLFATVLNGAIVRLNSDR
ncbi:tryptophan-rich sensory protein [Micromonospora sp. NBC_00858]|uniref:tryptophan-rich sensory protein n=1 Tax=Micromonospora sp. NBC_00858 TaxID=2975979 RepID=UPI00386D3BA4|nr:tryptophan-rich sensory protein [Micromonospora sp. NBC_00858]